MKLWISPTMMVIAVVIGLACSFAWIAASAPQPVAPPEPIVITPVPTPQPVYVGTTVPPTPVPTPVVVVSESTVVHVEAEGGWAFGILMFGGLMLLAQFVFFLGKAIWSVFE